MEKTLILLFIYLALGTTAWGQETSLEIPDYRYEKIKREAETLVSNFLKEWENLHDMEIPSEEEFKAQRTQFMASREIDNAYRTTRRWPTYREVMQILLEDQDYFFDQLLNRYLVQPERIRTINFLATGYQREENIKQVLQGAFAQYEKIEVVDQIVSVCKPCDNRSNENSPYATYLQVPATVQFRANPRGSTAQNVIKADFFFSVKFDLLDTLFTNPRIFYIGYEGSRGEVPRCYDCPKEVLARVTTPVTNDTLGVKPPDDPSLPNTGVIAKKDAIDDTNKWDPHEVLLIVEKRPEENNDLWYHEAKAAGNNTTGRPVRSAEREVILRFKKPIKNGELIIVKIIHDGRNETRRNNVRQRDGKLIFRFQQ